MSSENRGLFLGSTQTKDTRDLLNNILVALNKKDSGFYPETEFVNGQVYFPDPTLTSDTPQRPVPRQVYRKVINFGALKNAAGTSSVAHGITITAGHSFTRIYATASDPSTAFIPIPYASAVAADIVELKVDATDVYITVGKDMSAYTKTYVVLEWIAT